jgi:hypothetical protein
LVKFLKLTFRCLVLASASFIVALPLRAQGPLPDAKTLMEKHNSAAGGRAALDRHSSMKLTATVNLSQLNATVEIYRAKPDKFFSKTNLGDMGQVLEGYDGKVGWNSNPMGAQLAQGEMLDIMKSNADFFASFEDPTRYTKAETIALSDFDGRKCYQVRLSRGTRNATEYFDATTGLRAGLVVENPTPQGPMQSTTIFAEYGDYDGVKMPKRIESRNAGGVATITFTAVEYDKVDPAVFELPANVKALIKP